MAMFVRTLSSQCFLWRPVVSCTVLPCRAMWPIQESLRRFTVANKGYCFPTKESICLTYSFVLCLAFFKFDNLTDAGDIPCDFVCFEHCKDLFVLRDHIWSSFVK